MTSSLEKKELLLNVEKEKESAEAEDHTAASCFDSHGHGVVQVEDMMNGDMASMTAVVAAEEEVKQAVADDLNSSLSSPCDWFICDDHHTATRFFVIQVNQLCLFHVWRFLCPVLHLLFLNLQIYMYIFLIGI